MSDRRMMSISIFIGVLALGGCLFSQTGKLLPAPADARPAAAKHNEEGIAAHNQGQLAAARQHFEAAVQANRTLAEAHYNLGMVLYKMGDEGEANPHFMEAANLAPGNEVIWSSPPLSGVQRGTKSFTPAASDGHGHSH
ncbi:MAG: tetratricopeptide repeat protein [Nitrospirae bacterium]|nr:tetratricopeptide repeat protein [Nitrospirota bacterium]